MGLGRGITKWMATALLALTAWVHGIVLPSDADHLISLNGTWQFKLERTPGEPFFTPAYPEDATWSPLVVPGNWEIAGFSPATYKELGDDVGLYRLQFDVPESWRGRQVRINFDAVQNGAEIWCNGEPAPVDGPSWGRANYHESGWTAFQADLTPAIKFGQKNLLALRVTKNTRSAPMDCGDYFYLGGIHRTVTLFSVPQTHLADLTVRTTLLPNGKAEVKVLANVAGPAAHVTARLDDKPFAAETRSGDNGLAELSETVDQPRLWSAEHPNLYRLDLDLTDDAGHTIEHVTRRIGIRDVTTTAGVLRINGTPVKLAGICRHDIYPSMGSAVDESVWRKDIELMKAANINAIRTSHYPYGQRFYDLCDELGMYVVDEMPDFQRPSDDPAMLPAFVQRTREMVARDKNHPCVIIWTIANEVRKGRNLQACVDQIRSMDPTRPTIVSQMPADLYGTDLDELHYPDLARMDRDGADAQRRAKWPVVYLEHPNNWDVRLGADPGCWDRWAIGLQRVWDRVLKYDGMCGTFLWEWQDRSIADRATTKPYAYDPATGLQYFKLKGIVDGWRHPRPWYHDLKMVYSPIQISRDLDPSASPRTAALNIQNHYSFTNLSDLTATWTLLRNGQPLHTGTSHLNLPPRTKGRVELPLPDTNADTLRIDFTDPRGWNVTSCQFSLAQPPIAATPRVARPLDGLKFPHFNLITSTVKPDKVHWRTLTRTRAELTNVKATPASPQDPFDRPLSEISSLDADVLLNGALAAHLHAENHAGQLTYRLEWTGKKADIQELGWTFTLPHDFDHFSWRRQAPWSVYPESHIARPQGTARPDSADASLSDITRPDAFDFTSTKYDCDQASLADPTGRGLHLDFDPAQRHHVKAAPGPDGAYLLVVNRQCSPPRDYGSPIVKDLYLELEPGQSIEGHFTAK